MAILKCKMCGGDTELVRLNEEQAAAKAEALVPAKYR